MSWDKTEGGDFGHSSRSENFIRGLNIELANERNLRATAEAEVERLQTELAQLHKVAKAAKGVCALCPVRDTCVPNDCWVWPIKVALKEGE